MNVYCTHHNQWGTCTEEDYNDTQSGLNPSGMLRVTFTQFTQAVPFNTIQLVQEMDEPYVDDMEGEREFMRHHSKHTNLSEDEMLIYGLM